MRKIIIGKNERDLAAVAKRVLGEKDGAGLEALQRFNPHLVGHKVGAGTVLLVPDLPGLHAGTSSAIGGEVSVLVQTSPKLLTALGNITSGGIVTGGLPRTTWSALGAPWEALNIRA